MIHPTAVVSPGAILASDVQVGPYAVIEDGAQLGAGCVVGSHVVITRYVSLGERNLISPGAVIGAEPQDISFKRNTFSRVVIGTDNQIREHCTIHRSAVVHGITEVGNECFLMAGAHVGHDAKVGHRVILANGTMLGGHSRIGDGVFLGGGAAVHQFVRIGRLAICQGNSAITKSVPPFSMAAGINKLSGLNVIGLRRAGMTSKARASIKAAFTLIFRAGLNISQALERAADQQWEPEACEFLDFIRDPGKRGLCGLGNRSTKQSDSSE